MLARRIIAVSPDKAFAKRLAVALKAAGGAVETCASPGELGELGEAEREAALVVLHLGGELAGQGLRLLEEVAAAAASAQVIAILPRSDLAAVVEIMQASERIAGMIVAEDFDTHALSAMATRVLAGDLFGLEKLTRWGTQIHGALVGDYEEKSRCIAQVSQFAEQMGVRRKYREAIEQALDEMLMNALYDAPVDEHGRPLLADVPTRTRSSLRLEQKAVVQYACDGERFAIAVRDAFGTLERATVLRYLHKCLHSEQQIDRKAGGAGLGLYLITSASTEVYFNVLPGVATEAVCTFDLAAPKLQLERFGFFVEQAEQSAQSEPPARRAAPAAPAVHAAAPRGLIPLLVAAIAITVGLAVAVAWPRLFGGRAAEVAIRPTPPDAAIELAPAAATVVLDSAPPGAAVELDGKPAGTTPLTLTTLPPGRAVQLVFRKLGYQDAAARLDVPPPGKEVRLIQPLAAAPQQARIRLVSRPPGAQVVQDGRPLPAVTTPAEVLIEVNKPVRFLLTMPRRVPLVIDALAPAPGADGLERGGALIEGALLRVSAGAEGKLAVAKAPHCQDLALPAECVLAPGSYAIEVTPAQGPRITRTVRVGSRGLELSIELGHVDAGPQRLVMLPGGGVRRAAFEPGPRRITISDGDTPKVVVVNVRANATVTPP